MVDVSKHTFRGDNGKTYSSETRNYKGSSKTVTREKASTVYGRDKVVKVEKRDR